MKKLNLLKSLIIVISVLISTGKAFCEATVVQQSVTVVQPTVAVEKLSSVESGNINPSNGMASELTSLFNLNSNDEEIFFVIYSTLITAGGTNMSAFDESGHLYFANIDNPPTIEAVNNAKQGIDGNANVIGYDINLSGENITISEVNSSIYNESYKINLAESATSGSLNQTIGGVPTANTYKVGEDMQGSYSAVVYITATSQI